MEYKYEFKKEDCWYKDHCLLYNTESCKSTCVRYLKMHYLTWSSLIGYKQQRNLKLKCCQEDAKAFERLNEIKKNIDVYIKEGNNLFLYSQSTGNGKTTWMCKMLMSYFDKIYAYTDFIPRGLLVNTSLFLQGLKGTPTQYSSYVKELCDTVDVVVWDDICTKQLTPYEDECLFTIIDKRLAEGKSNFYTTNCPPFSNSFMLSSRLYSRIVLASEQIHITCTDMRGIKD